ncbi:hypothetical protein ACFO0S_01000 [Chryseomicrobium palamuruense]|uniref:Uncharacterized protein n=1 Tax=Chryseomicrobium palamuruense TaxID=682973 RepID=A0ABV8URA1_9BACL
MNTLDVLAIIHEDTKWTVTVEHLEAAMTASSRMITDTDRMSFVYLIENGDQYTYLHFDYKDWGALSLIAKEPGPVFLSDGSHKIELLDFNNELTMLLTNIEGNDNYGQHFIEEVEKTFKTFYEKTEE